MKFKPNTRLKNDKPALNFLNSIYARGGGIKILLLLLGKAICRYFNEIFESLSSIGKKWCIMK